MSGPKPITAAGKRRQRRERAAARTLARSRVFGLLARALRYPDEQMFAALREGRWAAEITEAIRASGAEPLGPFLLELRRLPEVLPAQQLELQRLHTALFSSGNVCPHHESDYLASHAFQKADLMADVSGFYAAFGFRVSSVHRELADFLGAELEFLYLVGWKEAYALRHDRVAAAICRRAQEKFLAEHLGAWVRPFRETMERSPAGPFYVLLARLVESFVKAQGICPQLVPSLPLTLAPELSEEAACIRCS